MGDAGVGGAEMREREEPSFLHSLSRFSFDPTFVGWLFQAARINFSPISAQSRYFN